MKPTLKPRTEGVPFKDLAIGDLFTDDPRQSDTAFSKALFLKLSDRGKKKAQWVNNQALGTAIITVTPKSSTVVWPVDVEWE